MNYRHNRLVQLIAELFTILGAAVDPTESFTSPSDNKRADLVLWMIGVLGDGAVACDVTVWSDFTMARLGHAANCPNFVLDAAEKMKNDKYTADCLATGYGFAAMALNPLGGFGPHLEKMINDATRQRMAEAKASGLPVRRIEGKIRRALEKISAEMARCLHRMIYQNCTARAASPQPTAADRQFDDHRMMTDD